MRANMIGYCYFLNVAAVVCGLPSITSAADHVAWSVIHSESDLIVPRNGTNEAPRVLWMKSWTSYSDWLTAIDFPRHLILYLDRENWSDSLIRDVETLRNFAKTDKQSRSCVFINVAESPEIYHRRDKIIKRCKRNNAYVIVVYYYQTAWKERVSTLTDLAHIVQNVDNTDVLIDTIEHVTHCR